MKIPPVFGYEKFKPLKKSAHNFAKNFDSKLQNCALSSKDPLGDSISFSSTAKYSKRYTFGVFNYFVSRSATSSGVSRDPSLRISKISAFLPDASKIICLRASVSLSLI